MDLFFRLIEQMQRQALGRSRADAGEAFELINQSGQWSGEAAQWSAASAGNVEVAEIICRNGCHTLQARAAEWPVD